METHLHDLAVDWDWPMPCLCPVYSAFQNFTKHCITLSLLVQGIEIHTWIFCLCILFFSFAVLG